MQWNANVLKSSIVELRSFLHKEQPVIILLQETWCTDEYAPGMSIQGYADIHKERLRARRVDGNIRGGVATLSRSGIANKCESNTYTVQQDDTY